MGIVVARGLRRAPTAVGHTLVRCEHSDYLPLFYPIFSLFSIATLNEKVAKINLGKFMPEISAKTVDFFCRLLYNEPILRNRRTIQCLKK